MTTHVSPLTPARATPTNLLALSLKEMERFVHDLGWPGYRTRQILRWLYQERVHDVEGMTDLSKTDRRDLGALSNIVRFSDVQIRRSADGTKKFLLRLDDGLLVESVVIPDEERLTLCLSTQVGCILDCTFCLTGQMGLKRNLTAHEIIDQVLTIQDRLDGTERLTNLVLMGMGEPLANFDAVAEAVTRLTNTQWGVGIAARRITLSTAGLASRIKQVAGLGVNLAISLNATTNEQRDRLMPAINQLHPLADVLTACRRYPLPPRRKLTFEYVLLAGENDSEQDAKRLVKLLHGMRCKVNLIPFNPFPDSPYRRPADQTVLRFQAVLRKAGFDALIRKSKGQDVLGACGQLGDLPSTTPLVALTPARAGC